MDAMYTLSQAEACEAMRAYLCLRGALPPHGTVSNVKQTGNTGYSVKIEVEASIGEPPAPEPESAQATPPTDGGKEGR